MFVSANWTLRFNIGFRAHSIGVIMMNMIHSPSIYE